MNSVVAITSGDPAGIGPEIVAKALRDPAVRDLADWIVVGDRCVFDEPPVCASFHDAGQLETRPAPGSLSPAAGRAAVSYVRLATEMCLRNEAAAMVTAPLNKEAVALSGMPFTGHTEYIAQLCGESESRMLLAGPRLRVIHATTHIPLRQACDVTAERIRRTIELGNEAIRLLGVARPRIAVCGLNPHAGEHGLFGSEDAQAVAPAIEQARGAGIDCEGPVPADTVFLRAVRGAYDLVVAMYHDQGHVPMKLLDFERTVNISVGLPIIRTSVDHGTAFDIAGQGVADPQSLIEAMKLAVTMAANRADRRARQ
jgi:4-hydroxythreonine-4-phosphate dehydrogenase